MGNSTVKGNFQECQIILSFQCDILFRPCYVRDTKSRNGIKHSVQ